ncbi:MAG: nitroreductase family deazaflavin-dependent oxidoreductase [Chloroflexales bacterium]|nr:nitroreductase family deazaflavin-dependent oxidoreductase [Chloroflexales bacterium]
MKRKFAPGLYRSRTPSQRNVQQRPLAGAEHKGRNRAAQEDVVLIDQPRTGSFYRSMRKITASRAGIWLLSPRLHVIDRITLALSDGQATLTGLLGGVSIVTLTTVGARTGESRSTLLHAIPAGESILVVASNWGRPRHPAWYHNLKAHPEATVTYRNRTETYLAQEVEGAERDDCWRRVTEIYPGYEAYQRRSPARKLPVIMLSPLRA